MPSLPAANPDVVVYWNVVPLGIGYREGAVVSRRAYAGNCNVVINDILSQLGITAVLPVVRTGVRRIGSDVVQSN